MKRRAAVAIAAAAILLVGCSSIDRGTIIAKVHEPESTTTITSCTVVGKAVICTPIPSIDDEDWRFDIRNEDETGWVYVTEDTFNEYDEGDFYG